MSVLIQFKYYIIYVDISFTYFVVVGSKYKFRVMAASASGISEPSQESEEIMIGNTYSRRKYYCYHQNTK